MRVIAVDPGYERVGIAIVEKNPREKERVVFSECFKTSAKILHHTRLSFIGEEIKKVIEKHKPDELAIEALFFNDNQKTAMKVAEARGIIIYEAALKGIATHEYTPLEVKIAVTGYGRSDKKQVISMIKKLVKIGDKKTVDDEFDAIAIGLTHIACRSGLIKK